MGLPAVITTDQGKEFRNLLNAALMKEFRIKHRLSTCYHPQANGLDERFNQTLCNALAKNAQEDRTTWDSNLKEIIYAYNTAVQESSRHTPFEAMFGRIARLPIDYNAMDSYDPEKQLEDYADSTEPDDDDRKAERQKLDGSIRRNIGMAQQKQKQYYDAKHGASSCFTVGDAVLKKDFRRKKRRGGKLDYRWEGPFVITASIGKGLFKLQGISSKQVSAYATSMHGISIT